MPTTGHPSRSRVIAAFAALYIVWGSTYLAIRWVVHDIPPFLAAGARHFAAGLLLYAWARARGAARPTLAQWKVAAIVGTLLLVVGNGLVNWSEQRVPSGLASLIVSSVPIWIVGIDWLRPGGVKPKRRTVAGLVLGTLGIGALVASAGGLGAQDTTAAAMLVGCVVLLVASFAWAGGSILSRQLPRHANGGLATSMEMIAAGIALIPVSLVAGDFARLDVSAISSGSLWALLYLVIFGSLVGFSAYAWLLRVSTPAKVATYAYVNPVVAVALGWAFAGERLSAGVLGAAAILLASVALITLPDDVAAALRRRLAFPFSRKAAR